MLPPNDPPGIYTVATYPPQHYQRLPSLIPSLRMAAPNDIDLAENRRRMLRGDLYYAFTPDLLEERRQCTVAVTRFNQASRLESRRHLVELWAK